VRDDRLICPPTAPAGCLSPAPLTELQALMRG
jgi:hypothetical protein